MSVADIIREHQSQLEQHGLKAEACFIQSQNIKAIYYKNHIVLSCKLTADQAHEVLQSACMIASAPAHLLPALTRHLHMMHNNGNIAVWGPNSFIQSSINTA